MWHGLGSVSCSLVLQLWLAWGEILYLCFSYNSEELVTPQSVTEIIYFKVGWLHHHDAVKLVEHHPKCYMQLHLLTQENINNRQYMMDIRDAPWPLHLGGGILQYFVQLIWSWPTENKMQFYPILCFRRVKLDSASTSTHFLLILILILLLLLE